ncbi:MAG: hypothetical protein K8R40_09810 [Anaerolineaceae bacterium]|nr:hypothetical protein [Anaerolineaceae bacterium]
MENSVKNVNQKQEMNREKKNWTTRTFVIGGILGTIIGLIGAYILIQNTDEDSTNNLTPATGLQLGLGILGVLRVLTH